MDEGETGKKIYRQRNYDCLEHIRKVVAEAPHNKNEPNIHTTIRIGY